MRTRRFTPVLFAALAGLLFAGIWSPAAVADDWAYTLRPGDDLWSVARAYCGSSKRAEDIARHNNLGNPASVRAGTRINIPTAWLAFAPSRARFTSISGVVEIRPHQSRTGRPAVVSADINMGDIVTTRAGSAQVEFADGSTLMIAPDSEVLFNKLTAFGPAGMVDTHLRFFQGQGRARVQKQNLGDRFRIQTPQGIAAVRGTVFRVGHETVGQARSRAETLEGAIAFIRANNAETPLPQGFGVVASDTGVTRESLLPAPAWTNPGQQTFAAEDVLRWRAVPDARAYIVTWYANASPEVIYRQFQVTANQARFDVEPGGYSVRVRAVSNAGLHGFEAQRQVNLLSPAPALAPVLGGDTDEETRSIQLRWDYASPVPFEVTIKSADTDDATTYTTRDKHLYLDLAPGQYTWQVTTAGATPSAPGTFVLQPPRVKSLQADTGRRSLRFSWSGFANPTRYIAEVRDSSGNLHLAVTTEETELKVDVEDLDTYTLTLKASQNNIVGEAARIQATPRPSHWWLLLLALPLILI